MKAQYYYCNQCKRVFEESGECKFCKSKDIRVLKSGTSVNIIGSKIKGKFVKAINGNLQLIIIDEAKNKVLKEAKAEKLRKVL